MVKNVLNSILLILFVIIFTFSTSFTWAAHHCDKPSNATLERNGFSKRFQSIVIAVHGWNGACSGTFGKGKENMLEVIGANGAYDVDCFDYDSRECTIDDARQHLLARIEELRNDGYREFALITHSTGGIIALELVLHEALDKPISEARESFIFDQDQIKLRGVFAWAAPINGVRKPIETAGKLPTFWKWLTGSHEAILPHLSGGSDYLKDLHNRLIRYNQLLGVNGTSRMKFQLILLQGQEKDFVVRAIDPKKDDWLLPKLKPKFVNTQAPHLDNVANAGNSVQPRFPAMVSSQGLDLIFGLYPRFEPYFTAASPVTETAELERKHIITGITNYTLEPSLFRNGRRAVSKLISAIFTGGYQRGPEDDLFAVEKITEVMRGWFENHDRRDALEVASLMLSDLESNFSIPSAQTKDTFGGESRKALRRLACDIGGIFRKVAGSNKLVVPASLGNQGKELREFERRSISLLKKMSPPIGTDKEVRDCVLDSYQEAALRVDQNVIIETGMIQSFNDIALAGKNNFPLETKLKLAEIFTTLVRRDDLANPTMELFNKRTLWVEDTDAPAWSTFLNDEQARNLGLGIDPTSVPFEQRLQFNLDVIRKSGVTETDPATSVDVGRATIQLLQNQPAPVQEELYRSVLDAGRASGFPKTVGPAIEAEIRAVNPSILQSP